MIHDRWSSIPTRSTAEIRFRRAFLLSCSKLILPSYFCATAPPASQPTFQPFPAKRRLRTRRPSLLPPPTLGPREAPPLVLSGSYPQLFFPPLFVHKRCRRRTHPHSLMVRQTEFQRKADKCDNAVLLIPRRYFPW